jgi:hypothetical protein
MSKSYKSHPLYIPCRMCNKFWKKQANKKLRKNKLILNNGLYKKYYDSHSIRHDNWIQSISKSRMTFIREKYSGKELKYHIYRMINK